MKKKNYCLFLLLLFITSCYTPYISILENPMQFSESRINDVDNPTSTNNKRITDYDSRGYLTGRLFYRGLLDNDSDGDYDYLRLDIEIQIDQTSPVGYFTTAFMHDRSFNPQGDFNYDSGMSLGANIGFNNLVYNIGLYNMTVYFNCTVLRSLKLTSSYNIIGVALYEMNYSSGPEEVDRLESYDIMKPIFKIPEVFDISTFNHPLEGGDVEITNCWLESDFIELDIDFNTYKHFEHYDAPYYFHLKLSNETGYTIGYFEEIIWLPSSTSTSITFKIPSEFIYAFNNNYGFSSDFPILKIEELTIIQLRDPYVGGYDQFAPFNITYRQNCYNITTINVTETAAIQTISEGIIDFGQLAFNDSVEFLFYPEEVGSILNLIINRTEPMDSWGSDFAIFINDGFGRSIDVNLGDFYSPIISINDWWERTSITHLYSIIPSDGPWYVEIWNPDWSDNPISQELSVKLDQFMDEYAPSLIVDTPTNGENVDQYYGIPVRGTIQDESPIINYLVIVNGEVVFSFNPFEGSTPQSFDSDYFEFIWYPEENLTGTFTFTFLIYDIVNNIDSTEIAVTINPSPKPEPEETINKGLSWLESKQLSSGAWEYYGGDSPGMTALATLCFIQAGLYKDLVVTKGINYLRNAFQTDDDPSIPGKAIFYGHTTYETSMAIISLIAYNKTLETYDNNLVNLIQDGVSWLVATQNDETWGVQSDQPWYGGWRYGYDHESSDLSVSQWVILALSAYGYEDASLWEKVQLFVERCKGGYWDNEWKFDGGYTYTPSTEDWRDFGGGSYGSMTAAGVWGLYLSGLSPDNENITSALDWIGNRSEDELVGQNPFFGKGFEYYWYLTASKSYLMAGRECDQWWYDSIIDYVRTHSVQEGSNCYWENNMGDEQPIFATVQAILAQQVSYGKTPADKIEISVSSSTGSSIYFWNATMGVGFNLNTATEDVPYRTDYSGILEDSQEISFENPTKGEYYLEIVPAASSDGLIDQQLVLRIRAKTEDDHLLEYETKAIDLVIDHKTELLYRIVISTITGLNIEIIETTPIFDFVYFIGISDIQVPSHVGVGETFDIEVTLENLHASTMPSVRIHAIDEVLGKESQDVTNWSGGELRTFAFHYDTTGLDLGVHHVIICVTGNTVNPMLIRIDLQVGNHLPTGEFTNNFPDTVSGILEISWNSNDSDVDDTLTFQLILIHPDGSTEILADLVVNTYEFDSSLFEDADNYQIRLEISDGIDITVIESTLFAIDNTEGTGSSEESSNQQSDLLETPSFELIHLLVAFIAISFFMKRKKD